MHCNVHHTFGRRPLAVKLASREHCEIHKKINEKTTTTETATGRMRYAEGGVIEGWGTADRSKKCQISVRTRHANVRHVAVCGGRCPKFTYAHPTRRLGERQQCLRCFSSHSTRSSPAMTNSHGAGLCNVLSVLSPPPLRPVLNCFPSATVDVRGPKNVDLRHVGICHNCGCLIKRSAQKM